MFRVEFIGIPGVGKSTVQKKLVQRLQLTDQNRYLTLEEALMHVSKSNMDKLYRYIIKSLPYGFALKLSDKLMNRSLMQFKAQNRFISKYGEGFRDFLASHSFDNMSIDDRAILISGFLETGALFECINKQLPENTVVFFEEGFVQKSLMFNSYSSDKDKDESVLFSYLNHVPYPHLIIRVKANLKICYERMKSRQKGFTCRLKGMDKSGILASLEACETHLQKVALWMGEKKNVNLIEVDNDQSLENVLIDLENAIRSNHLLI